MSTFVAIDFETATTRRDSACAVGLAAGCNGRVVLARTYPIRPPTAQFTFTERMVAHYSAGATAERGAVARYL